MRREEKPGAASLAMARCLCVMGFLVLMAWLGALLEHFHQHPGPLIWFALGAFVMALCFALFYWGVRSGVRQGAADQELTNKEVGTRK